MEFCRSWVQARSGGNCPRSIYRIRPATVVSSSGGVRVSWNASYVRLRRSYRREENSKWGRLSSTPPSRGQKGGFAVGPTNRGKGTKIIALADDHSLPLAVSVESASRTKANSSKASSDTASSTVSLNG